MGMGIVALLALCAKTPVRVGAATPAFVTLDPAFSRIVPDGAQIEKLAGGFQFTEGPVWDPAGFLLFSDIILRPRSTSRSPAVKQNPFKST